MIKINRPKIPNIKIYAEKSESLAPELRANLLKLIDENAVHFPDFVARLKDENEKFTKAEEETLEAINYYADPENFKNKDKKVPSFTVYKNKELREHIRTLFNDKCAYCDSVFLGNSTADIEHFRPKKAFNPFKDGIDEKLIEPGYYWLAADWHNLLWSCILCNRKSNLDQPNVEGLKPLGKKNRFPIAEETKRIRSHNQNLETEKAILLIVDPCADDPDDHFVFPVKEEKDVGIVRAKIQENAQPSKKGEISIALYGLNRTKLVADRMEAGLDLKSIFMGLLDSIEAFSRKKNAGEDTSEEIEKFKFQKKRFQSKMKKTSDFLSFKKMLLEDFKNFPQLQRLGLTIESLLE
ncbi:TIGR02646: family protein [Kordia sp. SMS9]|uniref:hypothetical protein n=1 Tax=Kordia sp. SMS9 TaxID=2282170 RepID=UPI000E0DAA29|nr:hypothetical protein [Kordia sp. SMS9]AXG70967.1 TIGR02646: family protein [Kordia sp. SMS9]